MRTQFNFVDGVVLDTSDPQQMARLKVWCPAIDGDNYNVDTLPWTSYVSPLAGQTRNYPAGSNGKATRGLHSYGFWAVPKVGATVVVALLYGDVNRRFYLGSFFNDHGNRSLPTGRNRPDLAKAPVSDTFDPVEPQTSNLNTQFSGNLDAPEARTRGAYERQVAQDKDIKDGTEGYQKGVLESGFDPQTYCFTTPGRHTILFQDNPSNSRLRLKTADGHQVIFDDANERIYISTNKGNTWLELDSDGHVHMYGAASVSIAAGGDINLTANGDVSISAGGNLNLNAVGYARLSACSDVSFSGGTVNISSDGGFNILAAGDLLQTASNIHLNGPEATEAPCAAAPKVIPNHEPWERPTTNGKRNSNWKK
jgi:hypothetical protein